jgi:tetratricopeptide (TPR) repeat protein
MLVGLLLTVGKISESEKLQAELRSTYASRGSDYSPLDEAIDRAEIDAWFHAQPDRAARTLDSALARIEMSSLSLSQRRYFEVARIYALASRPDRARAILSAFDAAVTDTTLRRAMQPQAHRALAEIALAEHRPRDAVDEIRKSDRLPDGPVDDCARCVYAELARAFDLAGMTDSAITTFEEYLATPYWSRGERRSDPLHLAGTYKRLGELYEAKGDREKAASYYLKFVDLWKTADPELQPRVAEVRRRLSRLSDVERR